MHLSDFQTPDMQMTTLVAESKELKSLLMKVKEESEKASFFNIQETKIMASGPITSQQIDGETMETVTDFIFLVIFKKCSGELHYNDIFLYFP